MIHVYSDVVVRILQHWQDFVFLPFTGNPIFSSTWLTPFFGHTVSWYKNERSLLFSKKKMHEMQNTCRCCQSLTKQALHTLKHCLYFESLFSRYSNEWNMQDKVTQNETRIVSLNMHVNIDYDRFAVMGDIDLNTWRMCNSNLIFSNYFNNCCFVTANCIANCTANDEYAVIP